MSMSLYRCAAEQSQRLVQISSCPDTHRLLWAGAGPAMTKMRSFAQSLRASTPLKRMTYELSGNIVGQATKHKGY